MPGQATATGRPRRDEFVGRQRELDRLGELMLERRIVTIVGAPGIGKTTLARACRRSLEEWFPGGSWFCDLSEARTAADVGRTVARAVGVRMPGGSEPAMALGRVLGGFGPALVVLDNVEQLAGTAGEIIRRWHEAAPEIGFLVTSRARLGIAPETAFELGPLSLPGGDVAFAESESVRLFTVRARLARDDYRVSEDEIPAITELVRQLDGNPLAIELAASRMGVLTPQQLVAYLPERFKLLASGHGEQGDRHATIRAAIDWSWNMLGERERQALAQLAVFRGGFSVDAAQAVVDLGSGDDAPWLVDLLQVLRDKSLVRSSVVPELPDELRFSIFISVREYAWERALELELAQAAADRHAAYFATRGADWSRRFEQTSDATAGEHLSLELENLIAAHDHSVTRGRRDPGAAERAVELALALDPLLARDGPFGLRYELVSRALEVADEVAIDRRLLVDAIEARGEGLRALGRMRDASADLTRARDLSLELADRGVAARASVRLGLVEMIQGQHDRADQLMKEALATAREAGHRRYEGRIQGWLGHLYMMQNRFDEARQLLDDAVALLREVGDRRFEGINTHTLAVIDHDSGRLEEAASLYRTARDIHIEIKDTRYAATAVANLGLIAQEQGDPRRAVSYFEEGLELARATGDWRVQGVILGYYARLQQCQQVRPAILSSYRRALDLMERGGEETTMALFRGYLGSLEADLGDPAAARESIRAASEILDGLHARYLAAVTLCGLHIELDGAREAATAGDSARADALCSTVRDRMAEITGRSELTTRSADVRMSAELVHQRIREVGRLGSGSAEREPAEMALQVCPDGRWFRLPTGDYVSLQRRRALRLMLRRLGRAYVDQPDQPLTVEELQEAGWPGERMRPEAGARRVYTALWALRKMGLREFLIRTDEGYFLSGRVELADDAPRATTPT